MINPAKMKGQAAFVTLASGMSLGPLLLIVLDPAAQLLGFQTSLLRIAVEEGRATLWWGSVVAAIYVMRDLF